MKLIPMVHDESDCVLLKDPNDEDAWQCYVVDPCTLPSGTIIENVGLTRSTVLPSLDFETYSESGFTVDPVTKKVKGAGSGSKGGLPVVGTPVYAEHHSTDVICLYYDLKDGKGRRGWYPGTPQPQDLLDYVAGGGMIEAFNITFEFWIWNLVCTRRYGWPFLQIEQCVCVMSRARRYSLPGGLGNLAKALGTAPKDKEGGRLIQKLCRPHTPTKKRPGIRWTLPLAFDDHLAMYAYCDQDVKTEDHAAAYLPDLTDYERRTWLADQRINARGVQVEVESLDACLHLMEEMFKAYTLELSQLTGGAVGSGSEVQKMIDWLSTQGTFMPSMGADDVKDALEENGLAPAARRVLEIRQTLAGANIKKLPALKLQLNSDNRLRDQYMYCGADRTGRWSAGGVQLQNITSKGPKSKKCESCGLFVGKNYPGPCPNCNCSTWENMNDWTVDAVEHALHHIKTFDFKTVSGLWGDPSTLLAGCLRGLFVAKEGHRFICCDFSAIEAVAAACLARCQWRIDVFNTHGKIYEMSAAAITGKSMEEYLAYKEANGFDHPDRKKIGKVAELASGYGGWIGAWRNFGAEGEDGEVMKQIIAWRKASPEIVEMWGDQYRETREGSWEFVPECFGLEGMAVQAILNPGQCFSYIDITYGVFNDILFCRLPSGRFLHYHAPRLSTVTHKRAKKPCYQITFMGYNSNSQKGPVGWCRLETYGGRLFENVVQAVSADIQAEALVRLENNNYPVVMHTHDEAIAEVEYGRGSVDEMASIMSQRPAWASWWPLRAAGWEHKRYQKD